MQYLQNKDYQYIQKLSEILANDAELEVGSFELDIFEIYIKNDYPIIIRYSVANLGEVKFCLAPKNNDD